MINLVRGKGLQGLCERIMRWAWKTTDHVVFCKPLASDATVRESPDINFRIAEETDFQWMCDNMSHLGEKAEFIIRQQYAGKDVTVVGSTNEEPDIMAFSTWLSHDDFAFTLLGDAVATNDVSVRRVWVPPVMRKRGFASLGMSYLEHAAFQIGARKIWSFVETDNVPSLLLHEKLGYAEYGHIKLLMRFGRRYASTMPAAHDKWTTQRVPVEVSKL